MHARNRHELLVQRDRGVVLARLLGHVAGQALDDDGVDARTASEVVEGPSQAVDREALLDPRCLEARPPGLPESAGIAELPGLRREDPPLVQARRLLLDESPAVRRPRIDGRCLGLDPVLRVFPNAKPFDRDAATRA